ncbi:MAG: hypothetical protein K9G59_07245 [Caulobacter sp.]|nr:hypothetical protein [Caulobacter sp.]
MILVVNRTGARRERAGHDEGALLSRSLCPRNVAAPYAGVMLAYIAHS